MSALEEYEEWRDKWMPGKWMQNSVTVRYCDAAIESLKVCATCRHWVGESQFIPDNIPGRECEFPSEVGGRVETAFHAKCYFLHIGPTHQSRWEEFL